jgi:hypothetical protein
VVPSGTGASEMQRSAPCQADPARRSEERPSFARQLYDGSDHPDSDSLQRRPSRRRSSDSVSMPSAPPAAEPSAAPRHLQSLLIQGGGAPDVHVSHVTGRGHDLTLVVAEAGGQPLSKRGSVLPPSRKRSEAGQPPSWLARSTQPPSRARWAAW